MNYLSRYILCRNVKIILEGRNRDREYPEFGHITPREIRLIINHAVKEFQELIATMPTEKTWGARMMVKNGIESLARFSMKNNAVEFDA